MPFAHIIVPQGALSVEKRQRTVELVTDAIIEAEGAPQTIKPYVTVLVSEASEGGWGVAGHGYTRPELRDLVNRTAAAPDSSVRS